VFQGSSPITRSSPSAKACQKSGPFPPPELPGFDGTMTLSDSRRGRRPKSAVRPLPSPRRVSPVTCSTFPTCHAQYPGGPQRGHLPVTSPPRAAFPDPVAGRHPRLHFRGLLRLHSRYGPPDCSAARWRPLSQGFDPASYPTEPLVSYRSYRLLSAWILPPLVLRAAGAHYGFRARLRSAEPAIGRAKGATRWAPRNDHLEVREHIPESLH
jgi:hypothetical protein